MYCWHKQGPIAQCVQLTPPGCNCTVCTADKAWEQLNSVYSWHSLGAIAQCVQLTQPRCNCTLCTAKSLSGFNCLNFRSIMQLEDWSVNICWQAHSVNICWQAHSVNICWQAYSVNICWHAHSVNICWQATQSTCRQEHSIKHMLSIIAHLMITFVAVKWRQLISLFAYTTVVYFSVVDICSWCCSLIYELSLIQQ